MMRKHLLLASMAGLLGLGGTPVLAAVQGEVLVGYGLSYDDNINLGADDEPKSEDIGNEIYLDVELSKAEGFFRYDVFGRTGFTAHSSSEVDDQLYLSGGADALWLIIPNRLTWDFSDVATIRRRNSRAIASDSNTEQTNFFRTGPTMYFNPTGRIWVDVGAYYQQSWFEFSNSSEYVGAAINGVYHASTRTRVTSSYTETHFLPENEFTDQVSRALTLAMTHRTQRGLWYVGGGASQVSIEGQATFSDEDIIPTYIAGLDYQLTPRWSFDASGTRRVITIGESSFNRTERASLSSDLNGPSQPGPAPSTPGAQPTTPGSQPGTPGSQPVTPTAEEQQFSLLQDEVDEFRYSTGFNVEDYNQATLNMREGQWGVSFRVFTRRIEVPEFQISLSEEARRLLFPDERIDADQDSIGAEFFIALEPRIRWRVDAGVRVEDREIESINIYESTPSAEQLEVFSLRETTVFAGVTLAASRYLSFGSNLESRLFETDGSITRGDVRSNRIFFNVEYSL